MNYDWDSTTKTLTIISDGPSIPSEQTQHRNDAIHIKIQGLVKNIKELAFVGYSNVETIEFPDSVEYFGNNLITESKIKTIHVPLQLITFSAGGPFEWNSKFEEYTINETQPNFKVVDGALYSKDMKKLVNIPPNYQSKIFTVPFGVTTILQGATDHFQQVEQLILPQTVTYISCILYKPKAIKNLTIFRNYKSDPLEWEDHNNYSFYLAPININDTIYIVSHQYATCFKGNQSVLITSTDNNRYHQYKDNILHLNTNINSIIYPKLIQKAVSNNLCYIYFSLSISSASLSIFTLV